MLPGFAQVNLAIST